MRFSLTLLSLAFLGLTSCIDSENPLSDPQSAKPAAELSGVWKVQDKDGDVDYYHVGLAGEKFPAGLMRMELVSHAKDGILHPSDFLLFTTTLGDRHFVNVTALDRDQLEQVEKTGFEPAMFKDYWIYEYRLKGDKIQLLHMDGDQKKAAIEKGKLKGVVKENEVSFKDTTENLVKFIASPDAAKLFQAKDEQVLERVK